MQANSERREFVRVELDLPVRVGLAGGDLVARVVNLGEQGLRYLRPSEIAMNEDREVMLEFTLPGEETIRVLGWVAEKQPQGNDLAVSVTFFSLPEEDALRIRRFVASSPG